ncbi:hypothetical protein PNOK_0467300 [Pyrrhoderma noxium]|uniref:BRCT domain-containing protein n=1 Tax=Pyrrhoderma noxium TaxID=2282107 RepID=A0A286UJP9_9AGAM|nr:hypothetical protein PNOK_0467300 [Pyrrhoderma noxium]
MIFTLSACFSPSVATTTRNLWALYGGGIAMTPEERRNSQWYFCIGLGDPSLAELTKCPIVVFHVNWIHASVSAKFILPLTKFVLDDDHYSPSDEEIMVPEVQGSLQSGKSQEATEINAKNEKVILNTKSTRLATNADRVYLTKRTRELSPAHQIGNQVRVVKKLKVGTECLLATSANGGSESNIQLITNSRLPHSSNSTPEKASRLLTIAPSKLPDDPQTSTSSPLLPVAAFNDTRITNSGLEQSDKRNNNVHVHISTPISINGISAGRNHNQDYWEDNLPEDEYPPACLRSIPTLSASDLLSSTNKSGSEKKNSIYYM